MWIFFSSFVSRSDTLVNAYLSAVAPAVPESDAAAGAAAAAGGSSSAPGADAHPFVPELDDALYALLTLSCVASVNEQG